MKDIYPKLEDVALASPSEQNEAAGAYMEAYAQLEDVLTPLIYSGEGEPYSEKIASGFRESGVIGEVETGYSRPTGAPKFDGKLCRSLSLKQRIGEDGFYYAVAVPPITTAGMGVTYRLSPTRGRVVRVEPSYTSFGPPVVTQRELNAGDVAKLIVDVKDFLEQEGVGPARRFNAVEYDAQMAAKRSSGFLGKIGLGKRVKR